MGIIQNLLEKGFSAFYKKISFLPQSFSTKEFSAYEPDASDAGRYPTAGFPNPRNFAHGWIEYIPAGEQHYPR